MASDGVIITHPNRDKASAKLTRILIALMLLVSAVLIAIVLFGGWDLMEGMQSITIVYILLYLGAIILMIRWNRGVLPVIAALAVIMAIFCGVAAPEWFSRDKAGFSEAALSNSLLGTLTIVTLIANVVLMVLAMIGFRQQWNVEVERAAPADEPREPLNPGPAAPLPA
jgi:hypothetical protein